MRRWARFWCGLRRHPINWGQPYTDVRTLSSVYYCRCRAITGFRVPAVELDLYTYAVHRAIQKSYPPVWDTEGKSE